MTRKLLLTIAVLAAIGGSIGQTASAMQVNPIHKPVPQMTLKEQVRYYKANIRHAQSTLHWFHASKNSWALDGVRYPLAYSVVHREIVFHQRLLKAATRNLAVVEKKLLPVLATPPHLNELICIHGYEGSWTDTGYPFWGGLQMDEGFQSTYAAALAKKMHVPDYYTTLGTADHWTPLEQMWVAEMAIASRGYNPWPNTARYCHLL